MNICPEKLVVSSETTNAFKSPYIEGVFEDLTYGLRRSDGKLYKMVTPSDATPNELLKAMELMAFIGMACLAGTRCNFEKIVTNLGLDRFFTHPVDFTTIELHSN